MTMKVTSLYHYTVLIYIISGNQSKWKLCISDLISGQLRSIQNIVYFNKYYISYPATHNEHFALKHSIVYATMRNLIQCMADIAIISYIVAI